MLVNVWTLISLKSIYFIKASNPLEISSWFRRSLISLNYPNLLLFHYSILFFDYYRLFQVERLDCYRLCSVEFFIIINYTQLSSICIHYNTLFFDYYQLFQVKRLDCYRLYSVEFFIIVDYIQLSSIYRVEFQHSILILINLILFISFIDMVLQ